MQNPFMRIASFTALAYVLGACAPQEFSASAPISIQLESITVKLTTGQEVTLKDAGLRLKLLEVNDSRCPQNVQCFWAGEVGITLEIAKIGVQYVRQPVYTLLDASARSEPKRVLAEGYELRILEVTPSSQGPQTVTLELVPENR